MLKYLGVLFVVGVFLAGCAQATPTPTPKPTPTATPRAVATPTATATPVLPTPTPSFQGQKIVGYTWGGGLDDGTLAGPCASLTQKYGATCSLIPGSSVGNLSKTIAEKGDPQADFLMIDDALVPEAKANGVAQKVDFSRVPNAKGFFKVVNTFGDYMVPWLNQGIGIVYRTDKVKTAPTKWADLWNSEYAGHVMVVAWNYNFAWAFIEAASVVAAGDPKKLDDGFNKIKALKPNMFSTVDSMATWERVMTDGDAWVAVGTNGRWSMLLDKGVSVGFVAPSDWPMASTAGHIALNSKKLDLGHVFANEVLDPRNLGRFVEFAGYGPVTVDASQYMSLKARIRSLDNDAEWDGLHIPDWDNLRPRRQEFTDKFNKEIVK